jgi:hypothetical protein
VEVLLHRSRPRHCWRWVGSITPRLLYSKGDGSRYQLNRRLSVHQNRPGRCEVDTPLAPAGNQTPAILLVIRPCTNWAIAAGAVRLHGNLLFFCRLCKISFEMYRALALKWRLRSCVEFGEDGEGNDCGLFNSSQNYSGYKLGKAPILGLRFGHRIFRVQNVISHNSPWNLYSFPVFIL